MLGANDFGRNKCDIFLRVNQSRDIRRYRLRNNTISGYENKHVLTIVWYWKYYGSTYFDVVRTMADYFR